MQNGKPVYSKDDDPDGWCYYAPEGSWLVTDTEDKDANKNAGSANSVEKGLAAPQLVTAWKMNVNGDWEHQPAVKLTNAL